jgi:hypothetical protein
MRFGLFVVLIIFIAFGMARAQEKATSIKWNDSTKGIYINGELDRNAQLLVSELKRQMVLITDKLESAVVLDMATLAVGTAPKEEFRIAADRASAISSDFDSFEKVGSYTVADETNYSFSVAGKTIFITKHEGLSGTTTEEKLWQHIPVWQSLTENYKPDAGIVAAISKYDKEASITIALGTWCPDSKLHVPRLLKALHEAGNTRIKIELLGIGNKFKSPVDVIKRLDIKKVPTVIVKRRGKEVGRIIENPLGKTMEEDLAAILAGRYKASNNH